MKRELKLYLIIAFLLGMVASEFCYARKVPDMILPDSIDPDLREKLDYITDIINNGRYAIDVSSATISSSTSLDAAIPILDDSGVTKRIVVSNGTNNYYVDLTQL